MPLQNKTEDRHIFGKADKWSAIIVALFICYFIYGLCSYQDYGVTPDDAAQRMHSLVTYNELFLGDKDYVTDTVDTTSLPSLSEYGADYGVIMQLPLVAIEHLTGFQMSYMEIYQMRHLYVFLWSFIAAVFFYQLCLTLTNRNRVLSFCGTLMLILSPRILADSMYNIKDALCMSLFVIALYFGVTFLKKESVWKLILFVIFTALCATSRIVGGVLIGTLFLVIIARGAYKHTLKKYFKYVLGMGALFLGIYVLATPKSWGNILDTIWSTVKTFSNYTNWSGKEYYMGESIKGTELPWHYLFVWIGITTPIVYLVFSISGIGTTLYSFIRNLRNHELHFIDWTDLFLLSSLAIPFTYVLIFRPVLYNGWRHFYFTYPLIILMGIMFLYFIWEHFAIEYSVRLRKLSEFKFNPARFACICALSLSFIFTGAWIVRNHPYEYVYFNSVFRDWAFENFDLDYWYISGLECYEYILDNDSADTIKVYPMMTSTPDDVLSDIDFSRVRIVGSQHVAEWVIDDGNGFSGSNYFECVKTIEVDGHSIRNVWRRTRQDIVSYSVEKNNDGQILYAINDICWTLYMDENQIIFVGELNNPVMLSGLEIETDSDKLEGTINLSISENGTEWYDIEFGEDGTGQSPLNEISFLMVKFNSEFSENEEYDFKVTLFGDIDVIRSYKNTGNRIISKVESNYNENSSVNYVIDECMNTRWEVHNQEPGSYLQLLLNDNYDIDMIQLDYGKSHSDYAKNLLIYTSDDGENWEEQKYVTEDNKNYYFDKPVNCQYIRLELGDTGEEIVESWSIYEIRIFTFLNEHCMSEN